MVANAPVNTQNPPFDGQSRGIPEETVPPHQESAENAVLSR